MRFIHSVLLLFSDRSSIHKRTNNAWSNRRKPIWHKGLECVFISRSDLLVDLIKANVNKAVNIAISKVRADDSFADLL